MTLIKGGTLYGYTQMILYKDVDVVQVLNIWKCGRDVSVAYSTNGMSCLPQKCIPIFIGCTKSIT